MCKIVHCQGLAYGPAISNLNPLLNDAAFFGSEERCFGVSNYSTIFDHSISIISHLSQVKDHVPVRLPHRSSVSEPLTELTERAYQ